MAVLSRHPIPNVLAQHLEDAAALRALRSLLVRAPHAKLHQLARTDERLAAHLDGLSVAGDDAARASQAALEVPGIGQVFVAALLALERRDTPQLSRLLALVEPVPEAARALASAFGWASPELLRGVTSALLNSPSPSARWLGLTACALHRVDPGAALPTALNSPDATLHLRALQAVGELGRHDLLDACRARLQDPSPAIQLAAARSAALLGDRSQATDTLRHLALAAQPTQQRALAMALFTADTDSARALVRQLATQGAPTRLLVLAAGWAGDVQVVPWLFKHMQNPVMARLAGEAFSFITGTDLAELDLDCKPPAEPPSGPNDNPADSAVALDDDESLPWPDLEKLTAWWQTNGAQFQPGTRYFLGEPPSYEHCLSVLKQGFQRQRMAAAEYLGLLRPGTPLFNVAAPAWRQERLLGAMLP